MKWNVNDLYRSKLNFNYEQLSLRNLIYNYQPIIGSEAIALYLFLFTEATNSITSSLFLSQERILKMTALSRDELVLIFSKLELLSLVEIFYNKPESRIIYVLNEPLQVDFLSEDFIKDYLINKIGMENIKINEAFLTTKSSLAKSFVNYTKKERKIIHINDQQTQQKKASYDLNIKVDLSELIKLIKQKSSTYDTWWDADLEKMISDSIVVYNLNLLDVYLHLEDLLEANDKVNPILYFNKIKESKRNNELWIDYLLRDKNVNNKKFNLLRNLSPQQFINLRLKRLTKNKEEILINNLKTNYHFSDEIINVLLDFSILKNDYLIVDNYILKIADSIQKHEIKDSSELIDYLRKSFSKRSKALKNNYYQHDADQADSVSINNLIEDEASEQKSFINNQNINNEMLSTNNLKEQNMDDVDAMIKEFIE